MESKTKEQAIVHILGNLADAHKLISSILPDTEKFFCDIFNALKNLEVNLNKTENFVKLHMEDTFGVKELVDVDG